MFWFDGVAFVLVAIVAFLMTRWAGFSYRSYNIHLASMFGTIMAWNVWFRIWPAQQKILRAVKEGAGPDAALLAMAGARSRHNTYMSVALFWGMINSHTTYFAGGNLGVSEAWAFVPYLVVTLIAWHIVWQLYQSAGRGRASKRSSARRARNSAFLTISLSEARSSFPARWSVATSPSVSGVVR